MKPKCLGRQDGWNYARAFSFGFRSNDILFAESCGVEGFHIHLWVTAGHPMIGMKKAIDLLCAEGNVESWSYGIIPAGGAETHST